MFLGFFLFLCSSSFFFFSLFLFFRFYSFPPFPPILQKNTCTRTNNAPARTHARTRRYLAEFQSSEARKTSASDALEAYTKASEAADSDLPPTHPIRLGLALNFSVFYYEILNSPERACKLAKEVRGRFPPPIVFSNIYTEYKYIYIYMFFAFC